MEITVTYFMKRWIARRSRSKVFQTKIRKSALLDTLMSIPKELPLLRDEAFELFRILKNSDMDVFIRISGDLWYTWQFMQVYLKPNEGLSNMFLSTHFTNTKISKLKHLYEPFFNNYKESKSIKSMLEHEDSSLYAKSENNPIFFTNEEIYFHNEDMRLYDLLPDKFSIDKRIVIKENVPHKVLNISKKTNLMRGESKLDLKLTNCGFLLSKDILWDVNMDYLVSNFKTACEPVPLVRRLGLDIVYLDEEINVSRELSQSLEKLETNNLNILTYDVLVEMIQDTYGNETWFNRLYSILTCKPFCK